MNTGKLQHESANEAPRRISIIYTSTSVTDQIESGLNYDDLLSSDWAWFSKLDVTIIFVWLMMITNELYIFALIGDRVGPKAPVVNSIHLLVMIVIILAFVIHYIWHYAANRAAYKRAKSIIYANTFYGPLIKQVQNEILEALNQGTHKDEPLTSS
jgi:uncharacterized membrane protein (DUF485 family)